MATGPIEPTVVGDVTVDRAIQAVATTLGALPAAIASSPPWRHRSLRDSCFPAPTATPVVRYHGGHTDQALALAAWPIGDAYARYPNLADTRVLQQVLNNRLIERLRIADGATAYSAHRTGRIVDLPRLRLPAPLSRAWSGLPRPIWCSNGSATSPPTCARNRRSSSDELDRARKPAVAALRTGQQAERRLLAHVALSHAQSDPRRLDLIRGRSAAAARGHRRRPCAARGESLSARRTGLASWSSSQHPAAGHVDRAP